MFGQRPGLAVLLVVGLAGLAASPVRAQMPAGDFAPPANEPSDPPVPSVALRVRVAADSEPGQEVVYRITVANQSRAAAHHVTVRNPLPAGTHFVRADPPVSVSGPVLMWDLGTLEPCAHREITLVLDPGDAAEIRNCARVQFEHGECVLTRINRAAGINEGPPLRPSPVPSPSPAPSPSPSPRAPGPGVSAPPSGAGRLQVRKLGPTQAQLNDIVLYRIQVTNVGPVRLRNVTLTDVLPEGLDASNTQPGVKDEATPPLIWQLGDLEPGRTREVRYDALLKKSGDLVNRAIAEAAGGIRQEVRHTIRVGNPSIAVTLTGPSRRLVNRQTTYQITVTNPGTVPITNVELNDELVSEVEFLSATGGGRFDSKGAGVVRWSLGTLPAGSRRTVRVTVRGRERGRFKNVATATADRGLIEQGITHTRFVEADGLEIEMEKGTDPVEVGREGSLTVRLINPGKEAEKKVTASVTLPDGLVILAAPGAEISGRQIKWSIANLAPGTEPSVTIRFRADRSGEMVLKAEASSEKTGPANPIKVEETLRVVPTSGS
jgi:uncharacterized repeat protein (TIGR01451 family)